MIARVGVGLLGVAVAVYGGVLLVSRQEPEQWRDALLWLAGGVLVHDGVLVPVTLLAGLAAARWLPAPYRRPAAVALVVVGPLTLLAVPVLGRFGARPDDPTLLDRPYLVSWAVLVVAVALAVALTGRAVGSRHRRTDDRAERTLGGWRWHG
ncbi:MAG TPA: hypothetical protein VNS46_14765 [Nocardioides sp.]|nr:hypothetical protein [Nocardioides sp.]